MRLRGTWQVVQFNWPKLLGGVTAAIVGAAVARSTAPALIRVPAALGAVVAGYTTVSSMIGTWWVYDASELRHWRFPSRVVGFDPRNILLVTAGFDEVSAPLSRAYPRATVRVVDMLDDAAAEEASIRRARRLYPSNAPRVAPDDIGLGRTYDLVVFAMAVHELREHSDRVTMFRSALATLEPGGAVLLVEHVRDIANVAVYGPGAWHFHTQSTWLAAVAEAGGVVEHRERITPFVVAWSVRPA